MALSTLLCRVPVLPLPLTALLDRVNTRKIQKSEQVTLGNGLTVVTAKTPASHSYVGFFSRAGSRYESRLDTRGTALLTNRALAQHFQGRSWLASSGVDREHAYFALESPAGSTEGAIKALGEVVSSPSITREQCESLLPQLFNETAAYRGNRSRVTEDEILCNVFSSTGLGFPVYPQHQGDFSNFNPKAIKDFAGNYDVSNSVLVAVGEVDATAVRAAAESAFGSLKGSGGRTVTQARFLGGFAQVRTPCHVTAAGVAYEAPPVTNSDAVAFYLLPHIVGTNFDRSLGQYGGDSWDARRLTIFPFFHEHWSRYVPFEDVGVYYFSNLADVEHGTNGHCQVQVSFHGQACLQRFQRALADEEFERAKARCVAHLASQTPTPSVLGLEIGKSVLQHGSHIGFPEIVARVAALSKSEFQEIINKHIFVGNTLSFAMGSTATISHLMDGRDAELSTWRWRD